MHLPFTFAGGSGHLDPLVPLARAAAARCLKQPNVSTAITGASRPEQVRENVRALDVTPKLTDEVLGRIEAVLGNKPQQSKALNAAENRV